MKKFLAACAIAVVATVGLGATAASADPSVTLCHDVAITVAGTSVVDDAACNTAP